MTNNPTANRGLTADDLRAAVAAAWASGGKPTRAMWVADGVFYDVDISRRVDK